MKISELISRLQYIQTEYETEDIEVKFYTGSKHLDLEYVDLARVCQDHLQGGQLDWYYICLRGIERKGK